MLRWLKNHFISHEGNHHHPHLLRTEALVFLLGLAIFAEVAFLLAVFVVLPQSGFLALITPDALVRSVNVTRTDTQKPKLAVNTLLERAAQLKANDMAAKSYFAHTSPAGITPWYWLDQVGYHYSSAGENLAVDFIDSSDVHQAWMNSPTHRANILNAGYTEIGIATAMGTYQGHETIFVVQFFGKSRASTIGITRTSATTPTLPTTTAMPRSVVAMPKIAVTFPIAQAVESSVIEQIAASPRKTTNRVLLLIGGIILLTFFLTIIVRLEFPHPRMVIMPMIVFVAILSLVVINQKLALFQVLVR